MNELGNINTTDYAGGYIYRNGKLEFIRTPEGYVMPSGGGYRYVYEYKDHLGNIRLSYANNDGKITKSEIIEENNYYPFGLKHKGYNNNVTSLGNSLARQYKYNGKELNEELGLNWYDYGARNYQADLGRWFNVDPLADELHNLSMSPYNYCANNPIIFVDPDGQDIYMYFYAGSGEKKEEDEAMFWAAALTRATDMLKNGEIGEGDIYTIRSISDLGKLGEAVDDVVNELSPKFEKTAEFGLWSHGALEGPIGNTSTTGENALDEYQMTLKGWKDINFNWKNDGFGAQAMFFGCRTAATENDKGESVIPWAQTISQGANMKNVEVWGQTKRSWPSLYPDLSHTTSNMNKGIHIGTTYMVGNTKSFFDRLNRKLGKTSYGYPMGVYQNGKFLRTSYQYWQKRK